MSLTHKRLERAVSLIMGEWGYDQQRVLNWLDDDDNNECGWRGVVPIEPEVSEAFQAIVNIGARESLLADQNYRMVDWLLSGAGRHWMRWQAEQGKQPTREDVAEAMEVGP